MVKTEFLQRDIEERVKFYRKVTHQTDFLTGETNVNMPSNKAEVSAELGIHQTAMHHPDGSTTAINIKGPNVGAGVGIRADGQGQQQTVGGNKGRNIKGTVGIEHTFPDGQSQALELNPGGAIPHFSTGLTKMKTVKLLLILKSAILSYVQVEK